MTYDKRVAAMRRFNRFYTQMIGALEEGLLQSAFTLTQARVLYELAYNDGLSASDLTRSLRLDPGYLSRILADFETRGLIARQPSESDGRQSHLALTERGREAFAPLDERSRIEITAMLKSLPEAKQKRLLSAMQEVEVLLSERAAISEPYTIRAHRPGDIGWIIHRHGVLYAQEYGWDGTFEALVAEVAAKFVQNHKLERERCWIAERDGDVVGSIFLVEQTAHLAKLRLLYVEPSARGLGLGRRLVDDCLRFARDAGYIKVTLWTNDVLVSARRIYEAAGFTLIEEERHHSFGHDLVGQNWELKL